MNTSDASSNPSSTKPVLTPEQIAEEAAYGIKDWEREHKRDADKADMVPFILSAITQALEQEKKEETFPGDGDRAWWVERRKGIRDAAKKLLLSSQAVSSPTSFNRKACPSTPTGEER